MTQTTDVKSAIALSVTPTVWPTATEAIAEVRAILAKDRNAVIKGEDGDTPATVVLELLLEFAHKDPNRRLRPLGWTKLSPVKSVTVEDAGSLKRLPVTRKSCGGSCGKGGRKGCC